MRIYRIIAAAALLVIPMASRAASCTAQAELLPQDRDALAAAGGRLSEAVTRGDYSVLLTALLPAEKAAWAGIRDAAEQAGPLVKGGQAQLRSIYLLDATSLSEAADTQFFCSNKDGTLTVTISMHALPAGRYALVLADAAGAPLGGQWGLILAWDGGGSGVEPGWKLAGLSVRQGNFDGHDGVWYWERARELAKEGQAWSAWYSYDAARYLQVPVDFISSTNLEKLEAEQAQIKGSAQGGSPQDAFPYTLHDGDRVWKIDGVRLDATLREPDLGVAYESTGVTDSAAMHTEAMAVMSALLKAQPGLRQNFHGLWAYAVKDGKQTPVMELPMGQIP
jgi:hypothetical protein